MKFLLTSAGITNDAIAQALEELAGKTLSDLNILFITTAANTSIEDKSWLTENIFEFTSRRPKSFDLIDIAGLPPELWQKHIKNVDVICVGGGDESYLARIFIEQEVKSFLQDELANRVYMGISAGSIVAGAFLPTGLNVELFGEDCESESGVGMELVNFNLIPHLNSPYFPNVNPDAIRAKRDQFVSRVIAIDDFTAIKINGDSFNFVGGGEHLEM